MWAVQQATCRGRKHVAKNRSISASSVWPVFGVTQRPLRPVGNQRDRPLAGQPRSEHGTQTAPIGISLAQKRIELTFDFPGSDKGSWGIGMPPRGIGIGPNRIR